MTALANYTRASAPVNVGHPPADVEGGNPGTILRTLYREDRKDEKGRGGTNIIHASQTLRMPRCSRAHYLMHVMRAEGIRFSERPFGSMRLVWAYGRAAEKHVRDTLLKDADMLRAAYGAWRCVCKHTKVEGHYDPSVPACPRCLTKPTIYAEALFIDTEYSISGNPDLLFLDGPRYRVIEIKSIKGKTNTSTAGFDTLEAPQPLHVEQGTHYVTLGQRRGLLMHRRPLTLYVNKEFSPTKWYKGWLPEDGPMERAEAAVQEQRQVTRDYGVALKTKVCPTMLPACVADASKHQKKCPAWAECMARKGT